jgi:hypothetical protein
MTTMKIDPYLTSQVKTKEELAKELEQEKKKSVDLNLPCLGNLVSRLLSKMSPYAIPRSAGIFKSLADVINNKHFKGIYPESFSMIPRYFRDSGISPYYEVVPGSDYSRGVLTINTMIELTASGYRWQLTRDQDVGIIIGIAEAYYEQLRKVLRPDSTKTEDIRNTAYADKLTKFLQVMHQYAAKLRKQKGINIEVASLADILELYDHGD